MVSSVKLSDGDIATLLEGVRLGTLAAESGIGSDKDYPVFHFGLEESGRVLALPSPFAKHDQTEAWSSVRRLPSMATFLRGKMQQNNDNRDDNWSNRLRDAVFNITCEITPLNGAPILQITDRLPLKRGAYIGAGVLENTPINTDQTTNITARMDHPNGN